MAFSLKTLLYFFALLAAALAVFGAWGLLVGAIVLGFWGKRHGHWPYVWVTALLWIGVIWLLMVALTPYAYITPEPSRFADSMRRLSLIALAVHIHDDKHGHFPSPFTTDDDGARLHSWRTQLWPYLELGVAYDRVDFAKPWDDPENLAARMEYDGLWNSPRRSFNSTPRTNYVAVVGDRTLWPTEGEISFADMSDRPSETILLIEVLPSFIHQMEPRDLTFDEAVDLLTGRTEQSKYLSLLDGQDILVAFADGHVAPLPPVDRKTAVALLTRSGGESIPANLCQWNPRRSTWYRPDTWSGFSTTQAGWYWALCVFVVLALLPALWIRKAGRDSS